MHATCRYFLRIFGPGPARSGVSSPQMTPARMISARIVLFAAATARAAWPGRVCTHRLRLGQVSDLVGAPHPQVSRAG